MQNFEEYAEKAMKRCNINSYNQLAKMLEIKQPSVVIFKSGKKLPSARTMVKLAKLAGVPEEKALMDLAAWANADKPEIADIYLRISKMIGCWGAIALFLFTIPYAPSILTLSGTVYYVAQIIFILLILRIFQNFNYLLTAQTYDFARYFGGFKNDSAY